MKKTICDRCKKEMEVSDIPYFDSIQQAILPTISISMQYTVMDCREIDLCDDCKAEFSYLFLSWLNNEPPVTPQSKIGHWVDRDEKSALCSCCGLNNTLIGNYCKWCGAKMVDEEG